MNNIQRPVSTKGVFPQPDMSAETVISEFLRPVSWDHATATQAVSYSNVSMHEQDDISSQGSTLKNEDNRSVLSDEQYDNYSATSSRDHMPFPITPPISDKPGTSNPCIENGIDQGPVRKKPRVPVPSERKDEKYWDRRRKNNEAAKRSRDTRKKRIDDQIKVARDAMTENQKLKQEIDVLKAEINSLRRLLKDANMTLSLWIRARQASEPNTQLPPMLRGSNLSFVNFPVTTNI